MKHGPSPEGIRTRILGSTEAGPRNEGRQSRSEPTICNEETSVLSSRERNETGLTDILPRSKSGGDGRSPFVAIYIAKPVN